MAAWFIKAGEYVRASQTRIGFVSTNSVTQGEQAAQLWPLLFDRCRLKIAFAHRTFAWGSDAHGSAHVHVVIVGLDRRENTRSDKRLFSYPDINGEPEETRHAALSPYLFDAGGLTDPHLTVREESGPINGMEKLKTGVQMIDNGILTFSENEKETFLASEPGASRFFRKYIGGDEFINGFPSLDSVPSGGFLSRSEATADDRKEGRRGSSISHDQQAGEHAENSRLSHFGRCG